MEMDREDAIGYLQRKDKIRESETKQPEFTEKEEEEIEKVIKKGKIYGDPVVELG